MQCTTAALCGAISILFAGCSTIVKGTEQQVSVNTPGVPGALCQLQSPAIGTRTVQTPANITLPKSKNNVAVSCTAQCYSPDVGTLAHTEAMAAGNVLFGGIIGLGIDAASGAMNTYDPGVEVIMTPLPGCGRQPGRKVKGIPMASMPAPMLAPRG
jgi:hypothetical protein